MEKLNPELILNAYAQGFFPMADSRKAREIYWYNPEQRGQISIETPHIPKRLRKTVRRQPYRITFNFDFQAVVAGCSAPADHLDRKDTWINGEISRVFTELHGLGYAHSVESWDGDRLVGGLYGLALGGAFFGESMFSTADDASKISLVHLMAHLKKQGFQILDTQFVNSHLKQFGIYEVPREAYLKTLEDVIHAPISFTPYRDQSQLVQPQPAGFTVSFSDVEAFLQSTTQIS